jgi:hypothetical protein
MFVVPIYPDATVHANVMQANVMHIHAVHTHVMNSSCDVYIYSNKATVLGSTITGSLENFGGIPNELLLKSPYRLKSDRTRCYQYNNNTPTAATCNPKKSNFKYFFLNAYGHLWKKCALDVAVWF